MSKTGTMDNTKLIEEKSQKLKIREKKLGKFPKVSITPEWLSNTVL